MADKDAAFTGSIPALYDRHLGPLMFAPYAADLAERLRWVKEGRVLETAAGTGIVTRAVARALPGRVEIIATDLNQAMLDFASAQTDPKIAIGWRQADATKLPFADATFDAVICQFGVMFFPDKRAAFAEALRVLKPGGRFIFNVWDRIEENELAHMVTKAVAAMFPDDPPEFLARTPYGHHDTGNLLANLRAAGFTQVDMETVERRSRSASARDPAIGFCQGSPLRGEIEARDAGRLSEATDAAAAAIAARWGAGPIDAKIKAHVFTATK